jgi:hypothetical protein
MVIGKGSDRATELPDLRVTLTWRFRTSGSIPVTEFKAFVQSARHYIEITADDPIIHNSVVRAVNGFMSRARVKLFPRECD